MPTIDLATKVIALKQKICDWQGKFQIALVKSVRHSKIDLYLLKKKIKFFYKGVREAIRIYVARKCIALYSVSLKSKAQSISWWSRISKVSITFVGIAFGALIIFSAQPLQNLNVSGDLFYAIAGIIGTILALTFSLSVLPVQKATESFGNIIAHIYRRDIVFYLIFFLLSFFCLVSVFLGIYITNFSSDKDLWFLVSEIIILAASLDLIRAYNDRSARFLTPREGITRLSNMAQSDFRKHHKNIVRYAKLQRETFPDSKRNEIQESDVQKFLYQTAGKNEKNLEYYSSDLFEMASRAIVSRQTEIVGYALQEIANIASSYLQIRRETFILHPATLGVQTSDANYALSPLFERLKDLAKLSFEEKDELSCKYIIRCIGNIVANILNLESTMLNGSPFLINWLGLGYLETAAIDAVKNKFPDAALEGVRVLNRLVENVPSDINQTEFLRRIIEVQGKLVRSFIASENHALAEEAVAGMLNPLKKALQSDLRERHFLWNSVLRELKIVFPIAVILASRQSSLILNAPLSAAYSGTSPLSLISLLADELNACEVDVDRPYVDPYHQFLECAEDLRQHFRSISDEYDLGNNPILYGLIQLVGQVSKIFLYALENPLRTEGGDEQELLRELKWQLSFLSNVFYNKATVDHNYATNAVEIAAYTGLRAYQSGLLDLAKDCRDTIVNITRAWARVGAGENRYGNLTDDFFESLWLFARAAEIEGKVVVAQQVNAEIEQLLATFSADQQTVIRERLERGRENINEQIIERDFMGTGLYCPIRILRAIHSNQIHTNAAE